MQLINDLLIPERLHAPTYWNELFILVEKKGLEPLTDINCA